MIRERGKLVPFEPTTSLESDSPDISSLTKSQAVYETLRHWILIGRLPPGQKLDQEWLASTLKVSRMPLRQALSGLAAGGLVINRAHRGDIVSPLSAAQLEDVYAGRRALETMLAEAGAKLATSEDRARMAQLVEQQETAVEQGNSEEYVLLDRKFHHILYTASGYRESVLLIERLRDMSDRYIRFYVRSSDTAHKSILDHWKILRAVERGQPELARQYTDQHIEEGYNVLKDLVRERELSDNFTDMNEGTSE
jgi:DNA-binding GntR family transcriptional regulator